MAIRHPARPPGRFQRAARSITDALVRGPNQSGPDFDSAADHRPIASRPCSNPASPLLERSLASTPRAASSRTKSPAPIPPARPCWSPISIATQAASTFRAMTAMSPASTGHSARSCSRLRAATAPASWSPTTTPAAMRPQSSRPHRNPPPCQCRRRDRPHPRRPPRLRWPRLHQLPPHGAALETDLSDLVN